MPIKRIRHAVGAVIVQNNEYLLVHKVKISTGESIEGFWGLVKGGVNSEDVSLQAALFRELREETGSDRFAIISEYADKIEFEFSAETKVKLNYDCQQTVFFLVRYLGKTEDLKSVDQEIDRFQFCSAEEAYEKICFEEERKFFLTQDYGVFRGALK